MECKIVFFKFMAIMTLRRLLIPFVTLYFILLQKTPIFRVCFINSIFAVLFVKINCSHGYVIGYVYAMCICAYMALGLSCIGSKTSS